ncbi:hypothetical protein ACQKWADRAFT_204557 [Trichoderma austrokoningii]
MPLLPGFGFGSRPGFGPRSASGSGSGSGCNHQPMSLDMQQFARQESLLAMAVNLPAPLPSSFTAPAAPGEGPAVPSSLQRRRLPPPPGMPDPWPSSLQLPGAATLVTRPDVASDFSGVYSFFGPVSAHNNSSSTTTATSPITPVRGQQQTRLPSLAAVTAAAAAAAAAGSSLAASSSPLRPPAGSPPPASSPASSSSYTTAHPVLPPLPSSLPQESSPTYLPWISQHHHFSGLDPLVSLSAPLNSNNSILSSSSDNNNNNNNNNTDASDASDAPAHFSTPSFNHFPALAGAGAQQPLPYWPSHDTAFNLHARWDEAAVPALPSSPEPLSPRLSDEASLLRDLDIHSDMDADFGDLRARVRARALATLSATSASAAPRQRHHHHRAIHSQAASPLDGFAASRDSGILDEPDDFPFPFPLPDYPPLSSSFSNTTMPRRSRRQPITSETPTSTSTSPATGTAAPVVKRQRIVPSGADASHQIIDDDGDSLFGDAKPLLVEEDYTTIDLTEATDVPDELKKPRVDKRVKLAGFQCVICMDDVTGLTLTHCGHLFCAQCLHSSLNIDSTRGKCPMCRSKIDMKPREDYKTRAKGYWPLELKLMTRTRQGKRKAQAMA